ncbi:MFS transporter [Arthrobacter sp. STN4]|uniref:MFS transporter n=1 Tax=Arthrobacter sp. STN4 TaxID=2923276 RepID=UPI00159EAA79|nr:MFS transporter [Arthrobacter sp. STN4]MCQ9163159.1 MFS transporter [Arthrobacter sp. STN4]
MSVDEEDSVVPSAQVSPGGILGRGYRTVTLGICALIVLSAFEALAVTTVMPTISAALNGAALYALAFAGPLAAGVVGMVAAGNWSDREGPRGPLYASVVLFTAGLAVVGTAPDMAVFLAGRLVEGLGTGALTVALYVVVARAYPPGLHPQIFAAFAACWVVPSLIGPLVAGLIAQTLGWRWVFLGVIVLVAGALAMVVPAMARLRTPGAGADGRGTAERKPVPWELGRLGWSLLAAVAVLALNLLADSKGPLLWAGPAAAAVVVLLALRPLLPRRTLRSGAGLPSVILSRGLASGAFFGADVYIPYLLTVRYGFPPLAAGLSVTASGVCWAGGSWLQSRLAARLSHARSVRFGALLLCLAIAAAGATAAFALVPATAIAGWAVGGFGMGLMYPRTSVATLEYSTVESQGFNSSALSIADSIGASMSLAATAIVFAAFAGLGGAWPFTGCFALTILPALAALALAQRIRRPRPGVTS